ESLSIAPRLPESTVLNGSTFFNSGFFEGGVSFWIPGFFGSLAAVPAQAPGWSVTSVYYHTSVSAGGDMARARGIEIGRFPANLTANLSANVNANVDLGM